MEKISFHRELEERQNEFRRNYLTDVMAAIKFRKVSISICFTIVSCISFAVFFVRSNDHAQSIDHLKEALEISEQKWTSTQNTVVIGREFFKYLTSRLHEAPYPGVDIHTQYVVTRLQLKPLRGVQPLRPEFGPVLNDVKSFHYPIEVRPCRKDVVPGLPRLFVAIISAPSYFEKRDIIRQTWLRQLRTQSGSLSLVNLIGFGFVVGRTDDRDQQLRIEAESSTYADILQIDMADVYYNLTVKVVGLLNWINDRCSGVDFVLKVDDDVYVNTRNLVAAMKSLDPAEQSVYGKATDSRVMRDGKFAVSLETWPWSKYPVYCMGAAVLIPGSTIEPLLAACQTIPYFPFVDMYSIGLCASKAGITVRVSESFLDAEPILKPCYVLDSVTWLTRSVDHLIEFHWATENFYKNVTPCILRGLGGTRKIIDSTQVVEFSFTRTQS